MEKKTLLVLNTDTQLITFGCFHVYESRHKLLDYFIDRCVNLIYDQKFSWGDMEFALYCLSTLDEYLSEYFTPYFNPDEQNGKRILSNINTLLKNELKLPYKVVITSIDS